jgi:hypothetical protein
MPKTIARIGARKLASRPRMPRTRPVKADVLRGPAVLRRREGCVLSGALEVLVVLENLEVLLGRSVSG